MEVWQDKVLSVRERREPSPVHRHSIHQPQRPQIKKLLKKHFFFMALVCAEAGLVCRAGRKVFLINMLETFDMQEIFNCEKHLTCRQHVR